MEIRPDRFKAVAGKTLGKIHRYTHISNNPDSTSDFSRFSRVLADSILLHDAAVHHVTSSHPLSSNY